MSRDIDELEPQTRDLCKQFLQACVANNTPMLVVQTFRSFEEQEALYAKGRTRPGPIVTWARAGQSWHNYRRAFDVCFLKGVDLSWVGPWYEIGKIGRDLGLLWGGDWDQGKQDRPHFEFHPGLDLEMARARSLIPRVREFIG